MVMEQKRMLETVYKWRKSGSFQKTKVLTRQLDCSNKHTRYPTHAVAFRNPRGGRDKFDQQGTGQSSISRVSHASLRTLDGQNRGNFCAGTDDAGGGVYPALAPAVCRGLFTYAPPCQCARPASLRICGQLWLRTLTFADACMRGVFQRRAGRRCCAAKRRTRP